MSSFVQCDQCVIDGSEFAIRFTFANHAGQCVNVEVDTLLASRMRDVLQFLIIDAPEGETVQ